MKALTAFISGHLKKGGKSFFKNARANRVESANFTDTDIPHIPQTDTDTDSLRLLHTDTDIVSYRFFSYRYRYRVLVSVYRLIPGIRVG